MSTDLVTQRELEAHLGPMKEDLIEIKGDVKSLLADKNRNDGARRQRLYLSDRVLAVAAVCVSLAATCASWFH